MKQVITVFSLMLSCSVAWGQYQTPLSTIGSAGDVTGTTTIGGNAKSVQWTLGETFIEAGTANGQSITIGEQQPLVGKLSPVGIEEPSIFSNVKVFPNPANRYVRIENLPNGNKSIQLLDMSGRAVQSLTTADNSLTLQTAALPAGIYSLVIGGEANKQTSFKISIVNN